MEHDLEKLVSIIIPMYNSEGFIVNTLESILKQTYSNWEAIIVDDCSSDLSAIRVNEYIFKDSRFKYFKLEKNYGVAIARNKAMEIANGEYIAFLDSDDIWFENKLTKQIEFMENNKYDFTCTFYDKIDEIGNSLNQIIKYSDKCNYDELLKNCPGNSTVIYNTKNLGKYEVFNIKRRNDYVLWLSIIKKSNYIYCLDEVLSSHRVRKNSISSNKVKLVKYNWNVYRKIEKLSFIRSCILLIYWIKKGIIKIILEKVKFLEKEYVE